MSRFLFGGVVFAVLIASPARATVVQYELLPLGGSQFRYVYTVSNDGSLGGAAVNLFDVLFDPSLYSETSLSISTQPPLASSWNEILLASAPGVPAAYDALATGSGIAYGQTRSGFAVDFAWLGTGAPGTQPFVIYDPQTFAVLEEGTTVSAVPLPPAGWLLLSGVAGLFTRLRARRTVTAGPSIT
jgi:hypothetical protein